MMKSWEVTLYYGETMSNNTVTLVLYAKASKINIV